MLKIYSPPSKTAQDLDEILALAEESEVPPPPPQGIPQQWVPGWIRWPLRILLLPFILLDLSAQRVARICIRTPFKKAGKCLRRGNCCRYILIPERKGILGNFFYFWNTQMLGFYQRYPETYENEKKRVYVMGCRYLKPNGSCGHYHLRPTVCRQWPMIEYFGYPRILKGCGFQAIPRDKS